MKPIALKKVVPLPFDIPRGVTRWNLSPLGGGEGLGHSTPDGVEFFEWPIGELSVERVLEWWGPGRYLVNLVGKKTGTNTIGSLAKRKLCLAPPVVAPADEPARVEYQPPPPPPMPVFTPNQDPLSAALALFHVINQSAETSARRAIDSERNFTTQTLAIVMGARNVQASVDASNTAIAAALVQINERLSRLEEPADDDDEEDEEEEEERDTDPVGTPKEEAMRAVGKVVRENAPGAVMALGDMATKVVDRFTSSRPSAIPEVGKS